MRNSPINEKRGVARTVYWLQRLTASWKTLPVQYAFSAKDWCQLVHICPALHRMMMMMTNYWRVQFCLTGGGDAAGTQEEWWQYSSSSHSLEEFVVCVFCWSFMQPLPLLRIVREQAWHTCARPDGKFQNRLTCQSTSCFPYQDYYGGGKTTPILDQWKQVCL